MQNNFTIVFCSCDAYSDLWENFFKLLKKYWPEYNGEIILNTETKSFQYEGLRISEPLNCSRDVSWSDRLSLSLKQVHTPYVLIFLDDFYLKGQVDNVSFLKTLEYMKGNPDVAAVTYLKEPGGKKVVVGLQNFLERKQFSLYKMTAHITLYRKDYLERILKYQESAWDFEVNGTIRSWFKAKKFLCPIDNFKTIFPYDFGALIIRGQYLKSVKEYFEKQEDCIFVKERPIMEEWIIKKSAGPIKKMQYLLKGLVSIFKKRAL